MGRSSRATLRAPERAMRPELVMVPGRRARRPKKRRRSKVDLCPMCGQRLHARKHLVAQLARLTGVDPSALATTSKEALLGLIDAWPKRKFLGELVHVEPKRLGAKP